ncbi:FAD-dependent monooxygenase [Bradyrhizobium barranii]|uniref:FAD-dependent monooxygenase n=1 Tax=Bradyrhizobium barranii TaxID=2992140 RepID=UPI002AB23047|nr:FAD-dependent monooxygenase [Bradyrhizobium barranii]
MAERQGGHFEFHFSAGLIEARWRVFPIQQISERQLRSTSTVRATRFFRVSPADRRPTKLLAPFTAPELVAAAKVIGEDKHISYRPFHLHSYRPFDVLMMPAPWHRGRVVLLGDAAHSLTPQMTSGGGMAIEDALVLAQELDRNDDL